MEAKILEPRFKRIVVPGVERFVNNNKRSLYVHFDVKDSRGRECIQCRTEKEEVLFRDHPLNVLNEVYVAGDILDTTDEITRIYYACTMCLAHIYEELEHCKLCSDVYRLQGTDKKKPIRHRKCTKDGLPEDVCPLKHTNCNSKNAKNKETGTSP